MYENQVLADQRLWIRLLDPFCPVETEKTFRRGIAAEKTAERNRLKTSFIFCAHRHARREHPFRVVAVFRFDRRPHAWIDFGDTLERRQLFHRVVRQLRTQRGCVGRWSDAFGTPPRAKASPAAARKGRETARNVLPRCDRNRVEQSRLRKSGNELILKSDPERHHPGE